MPFSYRWLLLALIWLAAADLRTATQGVSPILPLMQTDLGLSYAATGLLTMVPIAMMGLFAVPGGWIVDRLGPARTVLVGLALLSLGGILRTWSVGAADLFVYTALFGAGVGLAQPGLPGLVREWFPERSGFATGVYSNGLLSGALITAALSGRWLLQTVGTWRATFLTWGIVSIAVTVLWFLVSRDRTSATSRPSGPVRPFAAWRDAAAWRAVLFMVPNTTLYYVMASWLPTYYHDLGWDLAAASGPLVAMSISTIPSTLLSPWLSDRLGARKPVVVWMTILLVVGTLGLATAPLLVPELWGVLIGLGLSGPWAATLALPVDLAKPGEVGSMAGLILTMAFLGAIVGPLVVGYLRDLLGSFGGGMWVAAGLALFTQATTFFYPGRRVGTVAAVA